MKKIFSLKIIKKIAVEASVPVLVSMLNEGAQTLQEIEQVDDGVVDQLAALEVITGELRGRKPKKQKPVDNNSMPQSEAGHT